MPTPRRAPAARPPAGVSFPGVARLGAASLGIALLLLPALVTAHWQRAEDLLANLRSAEMRTAFGIVSAAPDPALARLLVVRVDQRWRAVSDTERRSAAETWLAHWREAIPQGIVAILDDATARPLVNFDATGRAAMKNDVEPAP